MRRGILIAAGLAVVISATAVVPDASAQAARVSVAVKDAAGEPIEGATLTATCAQRPEYSVVRTSNKKGKINLTHMESLLTYRYEVAGEGYQTQVIEVRPDYTETTRFEVVLFRPDKAPASEASPQGGGRALEAFKEGAEAQKAGDLDLAEEKFRLAAELSPDAAEPHIALAVVAHRRGDYAMAAAEAETALARSPNNQQAMLLRHDAYRLLGDEAKTREAVEGLRQAGSTAVAAGTVYNEAMADYRDNNLDGAAAKFEQALELDPTLVNAALMLGTMAVQRGDLDRANDMVARVLAVDPENKNARMIAYDAARASGDAEATRSALDALVAADPQWASTDLFNHAVELYNADDMVGAAAALERVVQLRPDDAKALFLLGMARYNSGDVEGAKANLSRFLELAPEDPDAALAREMLKYAQ